MTDIEQLLHLLRVSVRVTQNEKTQNAIIVSLRELAQRTRYTQNVECMLDLGSFLKLSYIRGFFIFKGSYLRKSPGDKYVPYVSGLRKLKNLRTVPCS